MPATTPLTNAIRSNLSSSARQAHTLAAIDVQRLRNYTDIICGGHNQQTFDTSTTNREAQAGAGANNNIQSFITLQQKLKKYSVDEKQLTKSLNTLSSNGSKDTSLSPEALLAMHSRLTSNMVLPEQITKDHNLLQRFISSHSDPKHSVLCTNTYPGLAEFCLLLKSAQLSLQGVMQFVFNSPDEDIRQHAHKYAGITSVPIGVTSSTLTAYNSAAKKLVEEWKKKQDPTTTLPNNDTSLEARPSLDAPSHSRE